jgi:lysine 2,3-aminomutase
MPNYLVSASDDAVVLRNFEGMLVRYQAEDKPATVAQTTTRGVSSLLQGTKSALIPENSERMARRALNVIANEAIAREEDMLSHADGHGNGCCGNGKPHSDDLLNLGVLTNGCGS